MTSRRDAWVRRRGDVLERRCGPELLLLVRGDEEALRRLEGVTAAVWAAVEEPRRLRDLIAVAAGAAGPEIERSVVERSVTDAVEALRRAGLVTLGEPPMADGCG